MKVVMVTSHPIQYQVPVFRHLAKMEGLEFSVLFAMLPDAVAQGSGFGVEFEWDVPMREGFDFQVLENVARAPSVSRFSGCDTPGIANVLKAMMPDAVIVNGWVAKTCLQALWACKRLGIPCIVRGEANNLRQRPVWKRWLQGLLVRQYSACLYIGEENRAFYRSLGVTEENLVPALYCVENERFETGASLMQGKRNEIRAQWNIDPAATCYLFCGKFEKKKHPLELTLAFSKAHHRVEGMHLLMVGDGELRSKCEAEVSSQGLPVTFAGFLNQSEIIGAYVAADCLVLPSDAGETWGLVVNEAMACGLPAIVSDLVGCASDLIVSGTTGDVFGFGDWDGLSDLLERYAEAKDSLGNMGKGARMHIQRYSPLMAARGFRAAASKVVRRKAVMR